MEGGEDGIEVGDDGDVGEVLTECGDVCVWWVSDGGFGVCGPVTSGVVTCCLVVCCVDAPVLAGGLGHDGTGSVGIRGRAGSP